MERRRDRPNLPLQSLLIAFALAIASFVSSTLYSQHSSRAIDRAAREIATNASPSIQYLSQARGELRALEAKVREANGTAEWRAEVDAVRTRVDENIDAYLVLPTFPNERNVWAALHKTLAQVDLKVGAVEGHVTGERGISRAELAELHDAIETAEAELRRLVEINAAEAAQLAARIETARLRADRIELTLDGVAAMLTVIVALLAARLVRHQQRVLEERNRLAAMRADELELFAGRVAHDVLGPLTAASLSLDTGIRKAPQAQETLERGARAIKRVQTIVDGLLRFARAGAQPEEGVRTELVPVLSSLADELGPYAAQAAVELRLEPPPRAWVACNAGVLTSLVENLVRNAVKYMSDRPERRITVRAIERGAHVRVEVEDTGPGIPADRVQRIFDPYVRGPGHTQPGIGLGLATVRRIAEAHGGSVGVSSSPAGSLFWFELPKARPETAPPEARPN